MKTFLLSTIAASLMSTTAFAGDVRIMWYSDGVEGEVLQDLMGRFMKDNPDIKVTIDNVSYSNIREQLPVQLAAGEGPDIARVTDLKALSQHWLDLTPHIKDAKYWQDNYGAQADWMRPDGSSAITGFMTQVTLTGGFANKTLFDQAGVPIPDAKASWDDWAAAAKKVADSQQVPYPLALDRSGHRLTGPAISHGANYIAADGKPAPLDQGGKDFITKFVGWNNDGISEKEVWVSAAGTTYRTAAEDFINGQVAYYYSGSWQIPNFATKIGDAFDWVATGSPCGPSACTGMPGGAGLVAVKYTKNPADVGKVMDFLASEPIAKEFAERTLFIPANKAVLAKELNFQTDNPQVKAALDVFVSSSATTSPEALKLPGWKWSDAYYSALVSRVSQAVAGELSLDDAFKRIDDDIAQKVKEAQ
ncbi:alpha-1,4-digalacturonate transport system substrate-binding protein [Mesorhizobium albiziae]|uniref:Alpha-1,4-digalacturonate transport system substrate-binding protein n=1 Tax=Neomesorhizobium albiziae TaxID=335020 RepID=A0A1I3VR08_9HYPH|nr:ABC transporter substrate-binding protein [Mesorhizobium albiziae]GLS29119.1 sugar ABC transporter substrate-binding protein [Mesorhizobium albiziae]SFJ97592.1 alpha-1,4-digalacturonate transport system substrate-binding protein [Mesorhizobium albiziae]